MLEEEPPWTRDARPPGTADGQGPLVAVPSNQGPFTMPNYEGLAAQGIRMLEERHTRVRRSARRDLLHRPRRGLRRADQPPAASPVLSDGQDADDSNNFSGVDTFSGFNVNTIAIEVPKALVTPTRYPYRYVRVDCRPRVTVLRGDDAPRR